MSNVEISAVLKRNLKDGKEYDKLIPRVKCERTNLGEGDTFNTVDWMKDWIEKFSHQTVKLSPKLKGHTLEETVKNIYDFLYRHVQYTADGQLQQLRSPACTWAQRKEGVDCKSYSVFASSILSNLGIKHFIRQVRQPYFFPEEFTHVYVVVPKDQNILNYPENAPTFVLDATKHQNTEGSYIEKVDLQMTKLKHVGLNAPQDERTIKIIENFNQFSDHLIANGIPLTTVNAIRAEVNKYTSVGQDPKFQIAKDGIVIQGKLFILKFRPTQGLGFVDPVSISGYAAAGSALLDMLPVGFIDDTFGAVMANGFSLGCWNTSSSPSKAKTEVAADSTLLYKTAGLEQSLTIANINKFAEYMEGYIASRAHAASQTRFAQCTRDGHEIARQMMQEFYDMAMMEIRSKLQAQGYKLVTVSHKTMRVEFKLVNSYVANFIHDNVKVPVFQIQAGPKPTTDSGDTTNYLPGGDQSGSGSSSSSKSNTPLIIGGVALAAAPLLFFMKKSPKVTPKKASK